jgi:D-3-phosphoglycerate dehydrogenase / 2-oxoglutarate reductase
MVDIRSRTQLTPEILDKRRSLISIGSFSVGTNQIALDCARRMGLPVFNAPFSNTRSVAELTIAEIIMLFRRVFPKSMAAHTGGWQKTAMGATEVLAKKLRIIGYGNIGSQLAVLAKAFGMRVIFYDRTDKLQHGNVQPTESLDELLARSDVVSLHVTDTPERAA